MADEKKLPEEKKISEEQLDKVAGGKGIQDVEYNDTVDIPESVDDKI